MQGERGARERESQTQTRLSFTAAKLVQRGEAGAGRVGGRGAELRSQASVEGKKEERGERVCEAAREARRGRGTKVEGEEGRRGERKVREGTRGLGKSGLVYQLFGRRWSSASS